MALYLWNLLCFIPIQLIIGAPQINLHLSEWQRNDTNDDVFQHDCLNVIASIEKETDPYQIISYCLTDWPSKWIIRENNRDQKLTFSELYQQNISSEQLYLWSAPLDVVERYQSYLNRMATTNESSSISSLQLFYNCTSPRFGSLCQYSLDIHEPYHRSLNEIIHKFYQQKYDPTNLTCYTHLECNRGSILACLDWTEICDGYIDCLNDAVDEKHCWQLEMNECKANEFRCNNGQCISKIFFHDAPNAFEYLDRSDIKHAIEIFPQSLTSEPIFANEDISCSSRNYRLSVSIGSSCVTKRDSLFKEVMFVDTPHTLSEKCWLVFKCHLALSFPSDPMCDVLCPRQICRQMVNESCSDVLFIPTGILAFGHVHLLYQKINVTTAYGPRPPDYVCYNAQLCGGFYENKPLVTINNATCRRPEDFSLSFCCAGKK